MSYPQVVRPPQGMPPPMRPGMPPQMPMQFQRPPGAPPAVPCGAATDQAGDAGATTSWNEAWNASSAVRTAQARDAAPATWPPAARTEPATVASYLYNLLADALWKIFVLLERIVMAPMERVDPPMLHCSVSYLVGFGIVGEENLVSVYHSSFDV
ncbi:unnamed protein product [Urochloa humidicola]